MTLFAILAALSTTTALAMPGTLEVKSGSFRVQREDSMKVNFYAGRYRSDISFEGGVMHLMVERKEVRTDAQLRLPSGTAIPENGAIEIDGFRTGQTFAVKGTISTTRANTAPVKEHEGCVYHRQEWVCHGWGHHQQCYWETVPVQGLRPVEYYFETKTVTLALALDSRNGGVSGWNGRETARRKIYTFQGQCY